MNYPKVINNTTFVVLLAVGAFAGFIIGVKLPAVFAYFYPTVVSPSSSIAATLPAFPPIIIPAHPAAEVAKPEIVPEVVPEIVPEVKPEVKPVVGPKTETLQLINSPAPVKDVGKPDLAVKVLEIGTIDKATNVFTATTTTTTTTLHSFDRIAVRFAVENLGTKETGSWRFNAVLPTYPSYIYSSESLVSLLPGDRIEFTLGFDSVEKKDGNVVIINADPANSIFEASEDNNIARVTIDGVIF